MDWNDHELKYSHNDRGCQRSSFFTDKGGFSCLWKMTISVPKVTLIEIAWKEEPGKFNQVYSKQSPCIPSLHSLYITGLQIT